MTYELLSLFSGLVGGALTSAVFTHLWRAVSGAREVPEPTEPDRSIRDVLVVGALQGAIFGVVKAGACVVTLTKSSIVTILTLLRSARSVLCCMAGLFPR